jgi:hypothetical protein
MKKGLGIHDPQALFFGLRPLAQATGFTVRPCLRQMLPQAKEEANAIIQLRQSGC